MVKYSRIYKGCNVSIGHDFDDRNKEVYWGRISFFNKQGKFEHFETEMETKSKREALQWAKEEVDKLVANNEVGKKYK